MSENKKKLAKYRNIPCYFTEGENDLEGRNWFYDICLSVMVWIDVEIFYIEEFPIWIELTTDKEKVDAGMWERADGNLICRECGKPYKDHPKLLSYVWITKLCDETLVKL